MITRIVKMTFVPEKVQTFLSNFEQNKEAIRAFEGCEHLQLLKEKGSDNVYFTYSFWQDESYLDKYRHSKLFKGVWATTKKLFQEKPKAWSLEKIREL